MINLELNFVHTIGRRCGYHVVIQLFQHHLFFKETAISPTELPWCICQKSIVLSVQDYTETFHFVPLIYIFILMLKPDSSDKCTFQTVDVLQLCSLKNVNFSKKPCWDFHCNCAFIFRLEVTKTLTLQEPTPHISSGLLGTRPMPMAV